MSETLLGPDPCLFAGQIGIARVDITPPPGIYARNWGAAPHDVADSIHRPLFLTALTVRGHSGNEPLVLVDADLGFWTALDRFHRIRAQVLEELNLHSARFIFALTHTHASPHLCEPTKSMAGGDILDRWIETLAPAIVRVVRQALATAEPSTLDWHTGHCALAANRDLPDPAPASTRRLCGYAPGVPADNTLLIGRVSDPSGRLRALLVNYACHPTTLAWSNHAISPDFIGAMRETIEAAHPAARAFFLQGASGELAPRYQYVGDTAVADRHGRQLGYAALATLEDMEPPGTRLAFDRVVESGAPLAVWNPKPWTPSTATAASEGAAPLRLKPDLPTVEELDSQFQNCTDRALAERLRRKRNQRRVLGPGPEFPMPVWAWRIGHAILVGSMGEAYSDAQITLRAKFPDVPIVCLNLINGTIGYLPPAGLYNLDLYQVWQSPFAQGSLERYIDTAAEMIRRLLEDPKTHS